MNKGVLLAILSVVLVAGCVQGEIPFLQTTTTVLGGTGMVMTDFTPDQTEVYGGQTNRIMMTVSNKGGHSVPDVDSLVYLTGSALELAGDDTLYWTQTDGETLIKKFGKEMKPYDPVRDIPADEKTFSWTLAAPDITAGQQTDYLFIGRVYYDYETRVTGNIWVYSEAEADAARAAGRTLNKATWSATAGPVAVNARVTQDPVVLYAGEDSFTLVIKVSNAGGGVLYESGFLDYSTSDPDALALTTNELNRVTVDGSVGGVALPGTCTGTHELVGGKDLTLTCDVTITPPATFQGFPITITADYGYFTERTATVSVSGR
jgi:hypothetical protein